MAKTKHGSVSRFSDFHAGRFLREELESSGHDTAWLAEQTSMTPAELERLFEQPNMDAMLFVRVGHPLRPHFFDRLHERIFSSQPDDTSRQGRYDAE